MDHENTPRGKVTYEIDDEYVRKSRGSAKRQMPASEQFGCQSELYICLA